MNYHLPGKDEESPMRKPLSHLDDLGRARMVDISDKAPSDRRAVAEGRVSLRAETLQAIRSGTVSKGEVLAVARIAGISAAKETGRLIPLCHPLPLTHVSVDFDFPDEKAPGRNAIRIVAEAKTHASTGVEMEALTAVALAALTIHDMCKGMDKTIEIQSIRLLEKEKKPR